MPLCLIRKMTNIVYNVYYMREFIQIIFACSKFWIVNSLKWTRSAVWCQTIDWFPGLNPTLTSHPALVSAGIYNPFGNALSYLWVNVENSEATTKHSTEPFYYHFLFYSLADFQFHPCRNPKYSVKTLPELLPVLASPLASFPTPLTTHQS